MTREEFLDALTTALQGELSALEISENIKYYNNYILEEIRKGKSEEEVLLELGEPRLIAKTIIETNNMSETNTNTQHYENTNNEDGYSQGKNNNNGNFKGFSADFNGNDGWDIRFGRLKLNTWYGKLILVVLAVLLISAFLFIITGVLRILLPVIIPLIIVLFLYALIRGNRNL